VRQIHATKRNACVPDHPGLDGAVDEVIVLHGGRRLHFDQIVAARDGLQDIRADQDILVLERCFEQRLTLAFSLKRCGCLGEGHGCLLHVADQQTGTVELHGQITDLTAGIENCPARGRCLHRVSPM
jgi:hypothetical protein